MCFVRCFVGVGDIWLDVVFSWGLCFLVVGGGIVGGFRFFEGIVVLRWFRFGFVLGIGILVFFFLGFWGLDFSFYLYEGRESRFFALFSFELF